MIPASMRDPKLERALEWDGFCLLRGLAATDLSFLRRLHDDVSSGPGPEVAVGTSRATVGWTRQMAPGPAWRIGIDECDVAERIRLHSELVPFWQRIADAAFIDHRLAFVSFLTKYPGPDGVLPLHQDPTFVDERRFRGVTAWIALDDITEADRNGVLHVLPGSHRVGFEVRGTRTEPTYINEIEQLWSHAVPVDARAGDVVVMDGSLLHGSPPNWSDRPRAALATGLAPRLAPLCHAVAIDDEMVEILRVDEAFYAETSPRSRCEAIPPGYDVVATVKQAPEPTSTAALLAQQKYRKSRRVRLARLVPFR